MNLYFTAFLLFALGNFVNLFYITALYHRGLAHGSIKLNKFSNWLVAKTGIWVTGIDPKAWVCMHRAHHIYSDTEDDPHSPARFGIFGVALGQLNSYKQVLVGLIRKNPRYTVLVSDLNFEVSRLNRKKLWLVPYMIHVLISIGISYLFGAWFVGAAYYFGIMSHPIHGWMVNSLAHSYGYRNFETKDQSTNNLLVSYLIFGEGFQNNHHARPKSANFAKKAGEVDLGYWVCVGASKLGIFSLKSAGQSRPSPIERSVNEVQT